MSRKRIRPMFGVEYLRFLYRCFCLAETWPKWMKGER